MNSADAWHESNEEGWETAQGHPIFPDGFRYDPATVTRLPWPDDPYGDMTPILEASVEEAKQRHPSASGDAPGDVLTKADRCDNCGVEALYRVMIRMATPEIAQPTLDFCHHHKAKHFPAMEAKGWIVVGQNPVLMAELYSGDDRAKGSDHA